MSLSTDSKPKQPDLVGIHRFAIKGIVVQISECFELRKSIPGILREYPNWAVHRDKTPYCADLSRYARSDDRTTWRDFEEALSAVSANPDVGLMFALGNHIAGIDVDGCRDARTGAVATWASFLLDGAKQTYAEISGSGTGIKIFGFARCAELEAEHNGKTGRRLHVKDQSGTAVAGTKLDAAGNPKPAEIEVYWTRRFFVVTGNSITQSNQLVDINDLIDETIVKLGGESRRPWMPPPSTVVDSARVDEVMNRLRLSRFGMRFAELGRGDLLDQQFNADRSRRDFAIACLIAEFTDDAGIIVSLMRNLPIAREKWVAHETYLLATARNAIAAVRDLPNKMGGQW